jgi:hypothetical protein
MTKLQSPNEKIQSCPINFPDTAFFDHKGHVTEIIKTDKEGFITSIRQENRLTL